MKILVTGGTGFVGTGLTQKLLIQGSDVTVISSSQKEFSDNPSLHFIVADTSKEGEWQEKLGDYDVIINLTGRSVFHLWTKSYKKKIVSSRIDTTRHIVAGLPDKTDTILLSASAAGFYGNSGDVELTEDFPAGKDFLADVCRQWEDEAFQAKKKGARVAVMRFGVVMGVGGGAIATMKMPFLFGLGGPIGDGRQWFPWIHLNDLLEAICFVINGSDLQGIFNMTAPGLVRQKDFARTLGRVLCRPAIIPAPAIIMKLLLGEFGQSLLQGQKAIPKALVSSGFRFSYPDLQRALEEILGG